MTAIANHPHRVSSAVAGARAELSSVADAPVWSMDPAETTATLGELKALAEAQVAELEARLLAHADRLQIAGNTAASSTANWHAVATRTTRPAAHRMMRTAHGLEQHEPTRAALADGRLQVEQAEVILRALAELPDDLEAEIVTQAEARLLDLAARPRRQGPAGPGPADPRGRLPRDRRRPPSQAVGEGGTRRRGGDPADHVGRRPRPGPRPVHPGHPDRRRPEEGAVGDRRPQTPGRPGSARSGG